jgi:hypothetical protein
VSPCGRFSGGCDGHIDAVQLPGGRLRVARAEVERRRREWSDAPDRPDTAGTTPTHRPGRHAGGRARRPRRSERFPSPGRGETGRTGGTSPNVCSHIGQRLPPPGSGHPANAPNLPCQPRGMARALGARRQRLQQRAMTAAATQHPDAFRLEARPGLPTLANRRARSPSGHSRAFDSSARTR